MGATDAVIIGGGFYGLRIALHLRESLGFDSVLVLEREPELMDRASYVNQARVHNGYHYPRSILTAYRSRVNFPRFVAEYEDAIVDTFDHYYAVAAKLSKTNARQFELFCRRIGAFYEKADSTVASWFDPSMIESVYHVSEPAFDSRVLREMLFHRISSVGGI
jgi:glycine/D-amino acid oxidase-like deaminating enzyme